MHKYTAQVVLQAQIYAEDQNQADSALLGMLCAPPPGIMESGYSVKILRETDD